MKMSKKRKPSKSAKKKSNRRISRKVDQDLMRKQHSNMRRIIPDADIMPLSMLAKRLKTRSANVSLSSKKRNKMIRQLRHEQKEKLDEEVNSIEQVDDTNTNKTTEPLNSDIEMTEES